MMKYTRNATELILLTTLCCLVLVVTAGAASAPSGQTRLIALIGDQTDIVFACRQEGKDGHWYANFGYYAEGPQRRAYGAGGRLCRLKVKTGEVTPLLADPLGTIRDPQVHYDGHKIVFSYRRAGTNYFHLYEIGADGSHLRQLTHGPYNDIEPTYVADGGILFCSDRCKRWVNCWLTKVAVMHRCDANGENIQALSSNNEQENTPWPLPDGRILYQRWEYVDRSQVHYHHLWTMNPDGTEQINFYGNMHPGTVMIDAKPIPGTDKVVAVFSPGHGRREHAGAVTLLSIKRGPDRQETARRISQGDDFRDPFPVSSETFLVAHDTRLELLNGKGQTWLVYALDPALAQAGIKVHEPRLLRPHPRERHVPARVSPAEATGRLILSNVYRGRRMETVKPGQIKKLLVLESLPMPVHYTGGMDPISYGGTFTLERVLGTIPVESDGSAYMELPALRSLFFVALDENDDSVKRMQSFLTVMPGETTSCVGCHESRIEAPANRATSTLLALQRPPSRITPIPGIPQVFDFPRDIQPILDRHCLPCHDVDEHAGDVLLTGDRGPMFSHSYYALTWRKQFIDGRNDPISNRAPRSIGAVASPLMKKLAGAHYDVRLSAQEIRMIRFWIESGAAYPGTYAALGSGMIGGYYENRQDTEDRTWSVTQAAAQTVRRRCASCHTGNRVLPLSLSDERGVSFWRPDPNDPRLRLSRHAVFNLTRPDKSLMLLAPLAQAAGGYGLCRASEANGPAEKGDPVFSSTRDPGYQHILALCQKGKANLEQIKRFDMPGFVPPEPYVREMKHYGVLAADVTNSAALDPYALDQAYWKSLWYKPTP